MCVSVTVGRIGRKRFKRKFTWIFSSIYGVLTTNNKMWDMRKYSIEMWAKRARGQLNFEIILKFIERERERENNAMDRKWLREWEYNNKWTSNSIQRKSIYVPRCLSYNEMWIRKSKVCVSPCVCVWRRAVTMYDFNTYTHIQVQCAQSNGIRCV